MSELPRNKLVPEMFKWPRVDGLEDWGLDGTPEGVVIGAILVIGFFVFLAILYKICNG